MMAYLTASERAVNPIIGTSVSTNINKGADYAVAGVPVVNTQNSAEYRALLEEYNCGVNCKPDDARSVADAIEKLYRDNDLRLLMSENAKCMGAEKFDRRETYGKIVSLLKELTV
jgi:glycosyltransferase involved in cell wall biosynthesis